MFVLLSVVRTIIRNQKVESDVRNELEINKIKDEISMYGNKYWGRITIWIEIVSYSVLDLCFPKERNVVKWTSKEILMRPEQTNDSSS